MRHQNSRRHQRHASFAAVAAVEPLESRRLLSSVTTSLKLVSPASSGVSVSSLKSGPASLGSFSVTSKSHTVSVIPSTGDLSIYKYSWRQLSSSEGGSVTFAKNSSNTARQNTISFSKSGTYEIGVSVDASGIPIAQGTLTFQVISTPTSLSVRSTNGQLLTTSSGLAVNGVSTQLSAFVLDQFGTSLPSQPAVTWTLSKSPTGSAPRLTTSQNAAGLKVDRAGSYSVTATSGTLKATIPVTFSQTLSTYTLSTLDNSKLTSGASLTVKATTLKLNFSAFDQFGQAMATLPAIKWTSTSPAGLKATTSLARGTLTITYSGSGTFSTQTTLADQTFQISAEVVPTLTSVAIQRPDGTSVNSKAPASTSGSRLELNAIALDQFGIPLLAQPSIDWQSTVSPSASNPKLTVDGNSVLFEPDVAGKYSLRAAAGSVFTDIPITVSQTLTAMSLLKADGTEASTDAPITVDRTIGSVRLLATDQFGKTMTTLPKITWTTAIAPVNAKATVKLTGTNVDVTFNRIGNYTLKATFANVTANASFNVTPTLTSFALVRDGVIIAKPSAGISVAGTSLTLNAVARDQFGQNLETQVAPTWQVTASPSASNPKLTVDGNSVLFEPDVAGKYSLRAVAGSVFTDIPVTVSQTLTAMSLLKADGTEASTDAPITVDRTIGSVRLLATDQFGKTMTTLPKITWTTAIAPVNAKATVKLTGTNVDVTFNRIGNYTLKATFANVTANASFSVTPTLTSFSISRDGKLISGTTKPTLINGKTVVVTAVARDQFGELLSVQPEQTWSMPTAPAGSKPTFERVDGNTTMTFTATGSYTARVSSGLVSTDIKLSVVPTAASIELTPKSFSLIRSASKQFSARAMDQFGTALATQPAFKWTATGGTISTSGLYVAGSLTGSFSVTVTAGTISSTASVEITTPVTPSALNDPNLNSLVNTFYADQNLDRGEMIQVLRSAGNDGSVNSVEFADLQFLTSSLSPFAMPSYVRSLASDVVGQNPANQKFQGQVLGNLTAGSSAGQLNKLVDKWFLGADEPLISTSGLTYQTTVGNLFNGVPSRADTRQGMLGDCYFIAAVASIADRNPDAVRNMFIDNGDGTYTVRFFSSGTSGFNADYVTVNRRLPAYSNGQLGYSGFGQSISQTSTTLWIALAEKAYAQWNETGLSGRDGTNRYSAIEGGWMWYVNAQVLGTNSTYAYFSSSAKSTLVTALSAQQAVTLGTWPNASAGGLYGSHAYIVTGYNSSTDTFTLHNPWGVSHPTPLTWAQLQSNCSIFVYTAVTSLSSATRPSPISITPRRLVARASVSLSDTLPATIPSATDCEAAIHQSASTDRQVRNGESGRSAVSKSRAALSSIASGDTHAESPSLLLPGDLLDLSFEAFNEWPLEYF